MANLGDILEKNAIGQNSNFQLQYILNETEHHPKILICSLSNKELCTFKNGGDMTCPTFSFWVLKCVKYKKFKAELF